MVKARVAEWLDEGLPVLFVDEDGRTWEVKATDELGTFAVELYTEGAAVAGVFLWDHGSQELGTITPFRNGDTYDVAEEGDFVVVRGQWVEAEGAAF